jgi:glycosyltransferase involved in cell wall biosynthesis
VKIAMVVPGGVDRSGEYRVIPVVLALLARLSREHEIHVFALRQESAPGTWQLAGAQIHNVGRPLNNARAVLALRREHRRAPFALVHALWSGWSGAVAVSAARLLGIPSLVHLTGGELFAFPDIGYGGQLRWHGRLRERVILGSATRVTATSAPIVAAAEKFALRVRRVPFGVGLESWPLLSPRARAAAAPVRLIHVASLNAVKDQTTLMHAMAALAASGQTFSLEVIGEDTLGGRIQALARALGIGSNVHFRGFMTQKTLRPFMEAADIHVQSSRHEAGPAVLLEAAVAGVPTVGTRVGHLAEWSADEALAVPPADPGALARAIARLVDDDALRLRVAAAAQRRALQEDADYTARHFMEIYNELTR